MNIIDYTAPVPIAAATIVPTYPLFAYAAQKRMEQGPMQYMTVIKALQGGVGASSSVAAIVGSQMIMQDALEQGFRGVYDIEAYPLSTKVATSALVGAGTAHMEYAFTQYTMGNPHPWKSVMQLTPKQAMLYAMRNGAAVCGMTSGSVVANRIKEQEWVQNIEKQHPAFGTVVDYASAFGAGAAGGIVGHPMNCKIIEDAMRQKGQVPPKLPFWKGVGYRALSVGAFSVVYKANMAAWQYFRGSA